MIFFTGDIHGNPVRLSSEYFPEGKTLTKDDYVIICGDFGLVWNAFSESKQEKYWLKWLDEKPWTTLVVDGNHENFERLYTYPVKEWNGGLVHEIRPSILHLMRGQVFQLQNKTFFTFGGASSHDIRDGILEIDDPRIKQWQRDFNKLFRVNHYTWWKEEIPTQEEMQIGFETLAKHNHHVDYIVTHCPPTSVLKQMDGGRGVYQADILSDYLQQIKEQTQYTQWMFGHMHQNTNFHHEKAVCLYEQICRLM